MKVSFSWLNEGQPFDLPGLPVAGRREIVELRREGKKVIAEWTHAMMLYRSMHILATKKMLDARGAKEAKTVWDMQVRHLFSERAASELEWEESEFEERFDAWYQKECLARHAAKDFDDAMKIVKSQLEEVDAQLLRDDIEDLNAKVALVELEWRLKRIFPTFTIDGEEVPMDRENLAKVVVFPEDIVAMRQDEDDDKTVDWAQELGVETEEVVEKKA